MSTTVTEKPCPVADCSGTIAEPTPDPARAPGAPLAYAPWREYAKCPTCETRLWRLAAGPGEWRRVGS